MALLLMWAFSGCSPALVWRDPPPQPECPGRVYNCTGSRVNKHCVCATHRRVEDFL